MQSFHELSFAEQRQINEAINATWSSADEPGNVLTESTFHHRTTIQIGELVDRFNLPDIADVTPGRAEHAARFVVKKLAERGVMLKGAKWLGSLEYYRWLMQDFLHRSVPFNVAPHRPESFDFLELSPNSVDNIFHSLEAFVDELFALQVVPRSRWFQRPSPGERRMPLSRQRYLAGFQASCRAIQLHKLRPTAVHDLLDDTGVRLDFAIDYQVRYENRTTQEFAGTGWAILHLEDGIWRLSRAVFPRLDMR